MKKFLLATSVVAVSGATTGANPIRRVVTLMQDMKKEIIAEGEKEEELFKKFMCYCKTNEGGLGKEAEQAAVEIEQNTQAAKEKAGQVNQLAQEISDHKKDRKEAKESLQTAVDTRAKEKAAYDAATAESNAYIEATKKAVTALEKGRGGAFLQTSTAATLKTVLSSGLISQMDMDDAQVVMSFLQGDYHSVGGEIIGILKNMLEEFDKSLGGIIATEEEAVKNFTALKAAKEQVIQSSTDAIEKKSELKGQLAVQTAEHKAAADSATKELGDAQEFLANLQQMCKDKKADWEVRTKERQEEVAAVDEAIGVLNDDDALDTFKKAIKPKEKESFLQLSRKAASPANKALNMLLANKALKKNPALSLLASATMNKLRGRQGVDFSKVLKMIDDMIVILKDEAKNDEETKAMCEESLRTTDAEKKETESKIASLTQKIKELEAGIATHKETVEAKTAEIKALDVSVKEATEQRTEENTEFTETVALSNSAVQLLGKAKNKLNKFYNPQLYVPPEEPKLTEEERILQNTQGASLAQGLPPPPETYGEHKKKSGKSNSVIALLDMLTNELKTEIQNAENAEKVAQSDYEKLVADAAKQRKVCVKQIADTETAIAGMEENLGAAKSGKTVSEEQLVEVVKQIADLHGQCDFILENFEERREARTTEIDGLGKAKGVLSGADYE